MLEKMLTFLNTVMSSPQFLPVAGIAVGVMILFFGVAAMFREKSPAAERMAAIGRKGISREERGLLKPVELDPKGMMKHLLPTDEKQRTALQRRMQRAGFSDPAAAQKFMLFRAIAGVLLPGLLIALIFASRNPNISVPAAVSDYLADLTTRQITMVLLVLVYIGYFLPSAWLDRRVAERSRKIEEAFPNALDLLQVSLEAGLGFDAAMTRVGNELATVAPSLASEFLTVQRQVQAGRGRDQALKDMATRAGVETVRSFTNVVQQAIQFGTPMTEALATYAKEMRDYREMRAQEMANKLPVKMSAVLASFMLPALVLLTLGPVIIRYTHVF